MHGLFEASGAVREVLPVSSEAQPAAGAVRAAVEALPASTCEHGWTVTLRKGVICLACGHLEAKGPAKILKFVRPS